MTLKEIEELAGHRKVSPWIVKLVGDAVAKEHEACLSIAESMSLDENKNKSWRTGCRDVAEAILARRQK